MYGRVFRTGEAYAEWLQYNDVEVVSVVVFGDELVVTFTYA